MMKWVWYSFPLHQQKGCEIFAKLFLNQPGISTLLESPYPLSSRFSRYSICANSSQWQALELGSIFPFLKELYSKPKPHFEPPFPEHLPFSGGWLGWLGYDTAWEIEQLPYLKKDVLPFPVACWYEPECFVVLDHREQILYLASPDQGKLEFFSARLELAQTDHSNSQLPLRTPQIEFFPTAAEYMRMVRQAQDYIKTGDIYQANLSVRFQSETNLSSWQIYKNLQAINPSPFASYWQTPWGDIVSCSPERLVELRGKIAQTRPIAGTRRRGQTAAQDRFLEAELLSNLKEQAEHIMLVDLERNDLARVCQWGTVEVDEFLTIEHYSHVMHLVSNVRGLLGNEFNAIDLIQSIFPGGTITGCPKVRSLEIIEELEPHRRNLFYGSCGYLDQRGDLDLNILIRTLLVTPERELVKVWGQVGAGIVADSDPEREWQESLQKAMAQIKALNKID